MTLTELNKAVCELVRTAAEASGTGAELVEEDLSAPILRPSVKVILEDSSEARATEKCAERTVTFRIYFFPADRYRPKTESLAMREALWETFLDGIPVVEDWVPIDEGLSFTVTDGVLVASMNLTLELELPETEDYMETLNLNLEVTNDGCDTAQH